MTRFNKLEFEQQQSEAQVTQPALASTDERRWALKANEQRRIGLYESALQYYSRALEEDKAQIDCWTGQVQMLVQLEEYPEAELWSRKALELFPGHAELTAARAQALCRHRRMQEAQATIDQALTQPGETAFRWMIRGELLLATRQKTHQFCFDRAMLCGNDWLAPVEAAMIYRYYHQPSNALTRARLSIERDPAAAYAWFIVACCQNDLGMTIPARRSLDHCLDLRPDYREAQEMHIALGAGGSFWKTIRRLWSR